MHSLHLLKIPAVDSRTFYAASDDSDVYRRFAELESKWVLRRLEGQILKVKAKWGGRKNIKVRLLLTYLEKMFFGNRKIDQ